MYSYQGNDESGAANPGSMPSSEQPSRLQQFLARAGSGADRLQDPSLQDPQAATARLYRPQARNVNSLAAQTQTPAAGEAAASPRKPYSEAPTGAGNGMPVTTQKAGTSRQNSRGLLDRMVDKIKGQEPPAPGLPAWMKPPGAPVGAPGSAQYPLVKAQDDARSDPRTQPKPNKGDTYCNIATYNTAKALNAPMDVFTTQVPPSKIYPKGVRPATANEMADNLARAAAAGKGYRVVTKQEAQKLANEGKLVIATQPAKNHGHVATVRPDNLYNEKAPVEGSGPVMNNVGRTVGVKRASGKAGERAFSSDSEPIYYTPIEK